MIAIFRKKRVAVVCALVCLIAVLSILVWVPGAVPSAAERRKVPVYGVETGQNVVALSFDAAWGADKTAQIMDILEQYGARGTFFLVGFWVDHYPEMVKEIAERGHVIGNHSTNHLHMAKLDRAKMEEELRLTNEKIAALTGNAPQYFRAPFGEYNNALIETADAMKMQTVQWSIDTLDWKGISGGEIADRVLANVKSGSIILCHNNSDHILEALPLILVGLQNKGLKAVGMDEVVMSSDFTIDANGIQKANKS